ncbi:MAG: translation initiation factor IF-2 N-terminal domain-containing protein, partial [Acidimicrobiales bacterium]
MYELAKELGLTNKEALDQCIQLGIGVKSHSSSIEDQQADRVRRKVDREGLRRDVQPEEPAVAKVASGLSGALPAPGESEAAERDGGESRRSTAPRLVTSRPGGSPSTGPGDSGAGLAPGAASPVPAAPAASVGPAPAAPTAPAAVPAPAVGPGPSSEAAPPAPSPPSAP